MLTHPKFVGGDCELSTTGVGPTGRALDGWDVTRALLQHAGAGFGGAGEAVWSHHQGFRHERASGSGHDIGSARSSDCLRHWATNGMCFYSDLAHWEGCVAETLYSRSYAAQNIASLHIAEAARRAAIDAAEPGTTYTLTAHNVDAQDPSISWGTHFNVAVTEDLFDDLFFEPRHPARLGTVASGVAAAIAFFGQGYLLPVKDGPTTFNLSGRAHHLSRLISVTTTEAYQRGILNSRREGHAREVERLHLIGFDYPLAGAALCSGFVQSLLAAAEQGYCGLNLYDPVHALRTWSWSVDLPTGRLTGRALLTDGRQVTLPHYVRELAQALVQLVEAGMISADLVPQAGELLPRVIELTHQLEAGALAAAARHLDWAAKLLVILNLCQDQAARLGDATTRLADQDYANTDPERGWFWKLWEAGLVDPLVTPADAERFRHDGPDESRGWARGRLIRRFGPEITDIDWRYVELRRNDAYWSSRLRIDLPRLDSLCRRELEPILDQARDVADLVQLLPSIGPRPCNPSPAISYSS